VYSNGALAASQVALYRADKVGQLSSTAGCWQVVFVVKPLALALFDNGFMSATATLLRPKGS
jgi:hypothetical protein